MKPDFYTKIVLTAIAIALVTLVFQNTKMVNEAKADKINFNKFASVPINDDGSINVKMVSDQMDVNIKSIGGSGIYGALPINFKELNGSSVGSYGLPVNITSVNGTTVYSAIPVKEQH